MYVRWLDSTFHISGPPPLLEALSFLDLAADPAPDELLHVLEFDAAGLRLDGVVCADPGGSSVDAVLAQLNTTSLAEVRSFAVHAGVVASQGRAAAFPAPSGAGKSTLVAACVQAGLQYVSDEALVVEDDGQVRPYPRPLALSSWSLDALGLAPATASLGERPVTIAELGGDVASPPLQLATLILIEPGPALEVQPLSKGEAATLLLRQSFNHFREPTRAFRLASSLVLPATCVVLRYQDPPEGAAAIQQLLTD